MTNTNNRKQAEMGGSARRNPATKYLNWKSNDKALGYWDKDAKENKLISLPFSFVFLAERHAIGGWSESAKSSIYSNEVKFIGKEPVTVKASKNLIVTGIYKEVKEKIVGAGGHYEKVIYGMDLNTLEIIKINLKGSACQSWGDFVSNVAKGKQFDFIVKFSGATDEKKGSVKFSKPTFELGDLIEGELDKAANTQYSILEEYFKGGTTGDTRDADGEAEVYEEGVTDAINIVGANEDDLPF